MRKLLPLLTILTLAWPLGALGAELAPGPAKLPPQLQYPAAKRIQQVDDYHGTQVADPYRWLESDGPDTQAWIEAQNRLTEGYLQGSPARAALRHRLEQVWNYPKVGVPTKVAGRYFWRYNNGLQNQATLCWSDKPDRQCRVLLDPGALAVDGTVSLQSWRVSPDGKVLAYALASAGSDWNIVQFRDVATGMDLPDKLEWVKFSGLAWHPDGKSLYYSRYAAPKADEALKGVLEYQQLQRHVLGTPQSSDVVIAHDPRQPKWGFTADVSDDGRFLIVDVSRGAEHKNSLQIMDLRDPSQRQPWPVVQGFGAAFEFMGNRAGRLYFRSDDHAPRGRVLAFDFDTWRVVKDRRVYDSERDSQLPLQWQEVVAQEDAALQAALLAGKGAHAGFVLHYLRDATADLRRVGLDGRPLRGRAPLPVPPMSTVSGLEGHGDDDELFFASSDFLTPPQVTRVDLASDATAVWASAPNQLNPHDYVVQQRRAPSRDGTRVPVFVVHRKGLKLDGSAPAYLYGYGGFSANTTPFFSPAHRVWLEAGGVLAVAVLRGGAEYGEAWHEAGKLGKKQNVFDDFIAAAELLVRERYTSSPRLAIAGGSNGGLLVGACMTQRPELFGAALPAVGVLDMLRFDQFTIGWAWVPEYGTSKDPKQFEWLYKYSPLHNLRPQVRYPATLVTTGDHDDRVVPAHSFKFTAQLQASQAGPAPTLIRVETRAGHGAGKPTAKQIAEVADRWAFLFRVFALAVPEAWR